MKPAFGPWTVPLTHTAPLLVHTGRDDRSEKEEEEKKNGQQQRNNKKKYVFVYVCA